MKKNSHYIAEQLRRIVDFIERELLFDAESVDISLVKKTTKRIKALSKVSRMSKEKIRYLVLDILKCGLCFESFEDKEYVDEKCTTLSKLYLAYWDRGLSHGLFLMPRTERVVDYLEGRDRLHAW